MFMNKFLRIKAVEIVYLIPAVLVFFLLAGVPKTLNYQGKLLDSDGVGLNDTLALTFRLYANESGGSYLWEKTITSVEISKGLFSVELSDFPDTVDFSAQYWLEIQVGSEILGPREKLAAAPYSIRAKSSL